MFFRRISSAAPGWLLPTSSLLRWAWGGPQRSISSPVRPSAVATEPKLLLRILRMVQGPERAHPPAHEPLFPPQRRVSFRNPLSQTSSPHTPLACLDAAASSASSQGYRLRPESRGRFGGRVVLGPPWEGWPRCSILSLLLDSECSRAAALQKV